MVNDLNLSNVTFCGLYCNECWVRKGAFSDPITKLNESIKKHGVKEYYLEKLVEVEPVFRKFDVFEEVLNAMMERFGKCDGCRSGGGVDPSCKLQACAMEKEIITCADCEEFKAETCELLGENGPFNWCNSNLKQIERLGVKRWIEVMDEMGYEGYSYTGE